MQPLQMTLVVALVGVGIGAGCYPKSAPAPGAVSGGSVAWASTKWPGTTEESLNKGRELFLAKCNGCHDYPDLASISDDEWPSIVDRMGDKVEYNKEQKDAVLHFVLAQKHP